MRCGIRRRASSGGSNIGASLECKRVRILPNRSNRASATTPCAHTMSPNNLGLDELEQACVDSFLFGRAQPLRCAVVDLHDCALDQLHGWTGSRNLTSLRPAIAWS